jgi:Domain of unknown function (DUF4878)
MSPMGTKQRIAQVAAAGVLMVVAGITVARKSNWRIPDLSAWRAALFPAEITEPEPQDTIYTMMNAARAGDVRTYLDSYTGPMLASLRQMIAGTTEADFGKYLKDSNAAVKGVTVFDPERISDAEARVRVEYVYQDRNETQTMVLEKVSGVWKISRTDAEQRVNTPIPYGTPIK